MKRTNPIPSLTAATLLFVGLSTTAPAAVIIQVSEIAGDVIFVASGSANLAGLTVAGTGSAGAGVNSSLDLVTVGNGSFQNYSGLTPPLNLPFGTNPGGNFDFPSFSSGGPVSISPSGLRLPIGYLSGDSLSASSTFNGQTFASFSGGTLIPGNYTWTWGSGSNADSITLSIGQVPEATSVILVGLGIIGLCARRRR
jgi:hypothetical protein